MRVSHMAKSIVAAIVAAAGASVTAMNDGVFSTGDIVTVVLATLGALGIVYAVPNSKPLV